MSDQDFFFEEEERTEPVKKAAKSEAPKAATQPATAAGGDFFSQSVTMSVASLMAVCGILVGVIGGYFLFGNSATTTVGSGTGNVLSGGQAAPQLTDEQVQSGKLPEGHPNIGQPAAGGAAPTGTATGSASTTGTK